MQIYIWESLYAIVRKLNSYSSYTEQNPVGCVHRPQAEHTCVGVAVFVVKITLKTGSITLWQRACLAHPCPEFNATCVEKTSQG